jgi:hypothetical protein
MPAYQQRAAVITNNVEPVTTPRSQVRHPRRRAQRPRTVLGTTSAGTTRSPTGAYTFKVTGTLGGKQVDESYTSGKDGFDEVTDPSEVQYPCASRPARS